MFLLLLARHLVYSRPDGKGGTITYYYSDAITWTVAALAIAWITWFFVRGHLRARALRRRPRRVNHRLLKRIVKVKNDLSSQYLRPGFSNNIHAVGIGTLGLAADYCLQVFISDTTQELWAGSGAAALPPNYQGVPLVLIEMAPAGFLSEANATTAENPFPNGIRNHQDVIIGGISAANSNLGGQSGTLGYFCFRKRKFMNRREVHLLSNSHVLADLRRAKPDDTDLIMQPSPGEPGNNRPIAALVNFSPLKFANETNEPNHIDAAIARLWESHPYKTLIPLIGAVKGYVETKNIEIGEPVRKFGRTTGFTQGIVLSIYLDILIRYDRTGKSAFFKDQVLIAPASKATPKFVAKGDSGSLVVDAQQHALGLIFGGVTEPQGSVPATKADKQRHDLSSSVSQKIEGYGVANPISEVLERLRIELV
jgi:hypothetical protein